MNLIREHELFEIHAQPRQMVGQVHGFTEGNVPIVISVYQQNRGPPGIHVRHW